MKLQKHSTNLGVSMFEMIVAVFIVAIILTAIASLSTTSIRNNTFSVNKNRASSYAQEGVEWLRGLRDQSFANLSSKSGIFPDGQTWCINSLETSLDDQGTCNSGEYITGTNFVREVRIIQDEDGDSNSLDTNITVRWIDGQGEHTVNVYTTFTNWAFLQ